MDQSVIVDRSGKFTLTSDDYVRAYQLNMIKTYLKPRTWLRYAAGILGGLVVITLVKDRLPQNPVSLAIFLAIALCIRLAVTYFFSVPAAARKRFSENKAFRGLTTFSWSEQEIQIVAELSSVRIPWEDMADQAENEGVLLFYPTPQAMHIVPKRALNENQIADLLNCASANLDR